MDGYEALELRYYRLSDENLLRELGFKLDAEAAACSLCPRTKTCRTRMDCDVEYDQVWAPTHVAAILKMNQPGESNANDSN